MYKIYSAVIYLLVFSLCLVCTNRADRALNAKRKTKFKLYTVLAIILPCLLAALRGIEVGTDTIRYYDYYESAFNTNSFENYFAIFSLRGLEAGYLAFNYLLAKLHFSTVGMSFCFELLIIVPVYWFAICNRNKRPAWSYMAVFLFIFYNVSYNATRQLVSMSFLLVAYYLLVEKKKAVRAIVFSALAMLFHRSAYIGIVFVLVGFIYKHLRVSLFRQMAILAGFVVLALSPFYFDRLFSILADIGLVSGRNSFYSLVYSGTTGNTAFEGLGLNGYFSIIMRLLFFVIPAIELYRCKELKEPSIRPSAVIVFLGVIFYASAALAFNTIHVYRITLYAETFMIPYFSWLYLPHYRKKLSLGTVSLRNLMFMTLLLMYWLITFMWYNYHQTSNYFMV